jgi:hypothetical protein
MKSVLILVLSVTLALVTTWLVALTCLILNKQNNESNKDAVDVILTNAVGARRVSVGATEIYVDPFDKTNVVRRVYFPKEEEPQLGALVTVNSDHADIEASALTGLKVRDGVTGGNFVDVDIKIKRRLTWQKTGSSQPDEVKSVVDDTQLPFRISQDMVLDKLVDGCFFISKQDIDGSLVVLLENMPDPLVSLWTTTESDDGLVVHALDDQGEEHALSLNPIPVNIDIDKYCF